MAPIRFDPADFSDEITYEYDVIVTWNAHHAVIADPLESSALPIYMILTPDIYATNAALQALDGRVLLRWSDPRDSGILSPLVMIRADTAGYPPNAAAGREVYTGDALHYLDEDVLNNETYYYSIWVTNDGEHTIAPPE